MGAMMPPMRVSIELVPRDARSLLAQVDEALRLGTRVAITNLPDLLRFDLRSWEAAACAREHAGLAGRELTTVPHLRAMDVDLELPWPPAERCRAAGIRDVVVIQGDPPEDMRHAVTGATSLEVIAKLRREHPDWTIYAALDPYRQGIAPERDYALRKLAAGADGFFTQPFFDLRLMGAWRDLLPRVPIFWGVTSVTSTRSMRYWTARNRAVFPAGFEPTLAWHRRFAADALRFAEEHDTDLYFMPIRVGIGDWLGDLLA
jgi:methylenetetrahydrofolate reductase (NADPH)